MIPIRLTTAAQAAALLALAGCGTSTPPAEPPPTSAAASPTATLTGKRAVEATVAAIGTANSEGGRADSTEVIWADDGPIITIPAADNLTQGLILAGWWGDAEDILRALQTSGVKADRATIIGTYPMQTADGEDLGEMVVIRGRWNTPLEINFDRTTAKIAVDEVTGRWAQ